VRVIRISRSIGDYLSLIVVDAVEEHLTLAELACLLSRVFQCRMAWVCLLWILVDALVLHFFEHDGSRAGSENHPTSFLFSSPGSRTA